MIRDNLHTFHLKLTTLSPIHIGTGEVYEPSNFVIDSGKLFEFDEVLFYKNLTLEDKEEFNKIIDDWLNVLDFYRSKIEEAKAVAFFNYPITREVENNYNRLTNKDGTRNKNQFQIHKTFKNPNTHQPIILGSSLKGMFNTIFKTYPPKSSNETRQRLILSDATLLEGGVEVGVANRIHKIPTKTAKGKIPQMLEVIKPNSTFELTLKTEYSFSEIQEMMKRYYSDRKTSIIRENVDGFVARVGKYCGKEYMVDDINDGLNSFQKPVATHTLYEVGNRQFGWIEVEDMVAKENRIAKKKKEEKARVDAMSPVEIIFEAFDEDITKIIQAMQKGSIEDFENIKKELAQEIKKILQQSPKTWDKAKKKALDRRVYIESVLK